MTGSRINLHWEPLVMSRVLWLLPALYVGLFPAEMTATREVRTWRLEIGFEWLRWGSVLLVSFQHPSFIGRVVRKSAPGV
jgi:hypothetical protein